MWCSDPFLTYLNSFGYSVIRLPKADIKPMQMLTRRGHEMVRLGEIATLFVAGDDIPLPALNENVPAANISGQRTSDLNIGVGLSILGAVIGAMGGSKLGLDVQYKQARTASFEFFDVLEDKVEVARLDQYLADATVNPFSRAVAELLDADDIYITVTTIKSKKLMVEAKTARGEAVELTVPEIQGIVGGSVKVSGNAEVTSKVAYEGSVPLVFGFQAIQLYFDQGRYTTFKPVQPGDAVAFHLGPTEGVTTPLVSEGALLRLGGE